MVLSSLSSSARRADTSDNKGTVLPTRKMNYCVPLRIFTEIQTLSPSFAPTISSAKEKEMSGIARNPGTQQLSEADDRTAIAPLGPRSFPRGNCGAAELFSGKRLIKQRNYLQTRVVWLARGPVPFKVLSHSLPSLLRNLLL
jgi:hypothetical protein